MMKGGLAGMMKQAQQMQEQMGREMKEMTVDASAGGGAGDFSHHHPRAATRQRRKVASAARGLSPRSASSPKIRSAGRWWTGRVSPSGSAGSANGSVGSAGTALLHERTTRGGSASAP